MNCGRFSSKSDGRFSGNTFRGFTLCALILFGPSCEGKVQLSALPDLTRTPESVSVAQPRWRFSFDERDGSEFSAPTPGQLRGLWDHMQDIAVADELSGRTAIAEHIQRIKGCHVNSIYIWVVSRYIDAVRVQGDDALFQHAKWDALGAYVSEAKKEGLSVYFWYSPGWYKETWRANELTEHPEWAVLDDAGQPLPALDVSIKAVRETAVQNLRYAVERYKPDGLQLEEPYYQGIQIPRTPAFIQQFFNQYGYLPTNTSAPNQSHDVLQFKRNVWTELVRAIRNMLNEVRPETTLEANGPSTADAINTVGVDVNRWVSEGLIDVFTPQNYVTDLVTYQSSLDSVDAIIGARATVHVGTGISWTATPALNGGLFGQLDHLELGDGLRRQRDKSATLFAYQDLTLAEAGLSERVVGTLHGELGTDPFAPGRVAGRKVDSMALSFDGSQQWARVPTSSVLDIPCHGTLAAWAKLTRSPSSVATIVERGTQASDRGFLWWYVDSELRMNYQIAAGSEYFTLKSDPVALLDDAWHHLAIVHDRSNRSVTFYFDGRAVGAGAFSAVCLPSVSGDMWIGTYGGKADAQYLWAGLLDDLAFYRSALSSAQIERLAAE